MMVGLHSKSFFSLVFSVFIMAGEVYGISWNKTNKKICDMPHEPWKGSSFLTALAFKASFMLHHWHCTYWIRRVAFHHGEEKLVYVCIHTAASLLE